MRIALFLHNLDEDYQINVFRGIRGTAQRHGVDLLCIQGEALPTEAQDFHFDGLLVLTSVMLDRAGRRAASGLAGRLPNTPAVSIGLRLPGIDSVTLRSVPSLRRLVEHLVVHHGYRKLLFIGGPPSHPDNQLRERVFVGTLTKLATARPDLTWTLDHGQFHEPSGMTAVSRHLDGPAYDVVVAANDAMALGAQKVLAVQPDPAWRRCAVVGFDDVPQAALAEPPLTTVHTPLADLGSQALERLLKRIQGAAAGHQTVGTRLVVRQSCGCGNLAIAPSQPEALAVRLAEVRRRVLETERWLRAANDFGRQLGASTDRKALVDELDGYLTLLGLKDFFLVVEDRLWYERIAGARSPLSDTHTPVTLEAVFSGRAASLGPAWTLCLFRLRTESGPHGAAVYSVDDTNVMYLSAALPHVANAVERIRNQDQQDVRRRELDAMVQVRTAELTRANEGLQREVRLRRAAEAEVLRVSEFERRRFGLDLHDDICQRLAGLTMVVRSLVLQAPPGDAGLGEVGRLLEETLQLTRQYAHASFPIDLEQRGLELVLRSLCEAITRRGLTCRFSCRLPVQHPPFTGPNALHVYRIVQEALQNALKHSGADRVDVTLAWREEGLIVRVADNGRGFEAQAKPQGGLGMRFMAYRAAQLGAQLVVTSQPGKGTVIQATVPHSPEGEAGGPT